MVSVTLALGERGEKKDCGGLLTTSLAPSAVGDFLSRELSKAQSDKVDHLLWPPYICIHTAHTHTHRHVPHTYAGLGKISESN